MNEKVIVDLVRNIGPYEGIVVTTPNTGIYEMFYSGLFILDFHNAFIFIKDYVGPKMMTKRLMNYVELNYPDWTIKYYDDKDDTFCSQNELIDKYPENIVTKGSMRRFSLTGFTQSLTLPDWYEINDLLDYITENEKIIKKANK